MLDGAPFDALVVLRKRSDGLDSLVKRTGGRYVVEEARDPVWILALPGGGLISYEQPDGWLRHTLGDVGGVRGA